MEKKKGPGLNTYPVKFETAFNELEEILGTTDEELIRIKAAISI